MNAPEPVSLTVHDGSQATEARQIVRTLALRARFSTEVTGRAELVATEAATNLVKHAGGGDLILRLVNLPGQPAIDVFATDRGPGMANLAACLRDGYSSAGTRGTGLGAIARQATFFDAYSRPGQGTVLMARVTAERMAPSPEPILVDGLSLHMHGEAVCGDGWASRAHPRSALIMVADGLGHGAVAADAAGEAVAAFRQATEDNPLQVVDRIHRALMKTRGAAVAVAAVDSSRRLVCYSGAGNISATIEDGGPARHLVSVHGTAGHQVRRLQEFSYPWSPDAILVMHSDGVTAHWSLQNYPGLRQRHPAVIAAVLLRDFSRRRDDATVVVAKAVDGVEPLTSPGR